MPIMSQLLANIFVPPVRFAFPRLILPIAILAVLTEIALAPSGPPQVAEPLPKAGLEVQH